MGKTRQTCTAHLAGPGWEFPSSAFLPTSPTGSFRWVQTIQPHQHTTTHASPCCSPAPAEPHHGGSTWPGKMPRTNWWVKKTWIVNVLCIDVYDEIFLVAFVLGRLWSHPIPHFFFFFKDAPGISPNIIHCYDGYHPRISHPHRAAPSRVQHTAAPSMLGNVQRTALSALLPSSSCEFKRKSPNVSGIHVAHHTSHAICHCSWLTNKKLLLLCRISNLLFMLQFFAITVMQRLYI